MQHIAPWCIYFYVITLNVIVDNMVYVMNHIIVITPVEPITLDYNMVGVAVAMVILTMHE